MPNYHITLTGELKPENLRIKRERSVIAPIPVFIKISSTGVKLFAKTKRHALEKAWRYFNEQSKANLQVPVFSGIAEEKNEKV